MTSISCIELSSCLLVYECCQVFYSLCTLNERHTNVKMSFLMYLEDEYAGIEDSYSILFNTILQLFYSFHPEKHTLEDIEEKLEQSFSTMKETYKDITQEHIDMMLQSIIHYANDMLEDFSNEIKN